MRSGILVALSLLSLALAGCIANPAQSGLAPGATTPPPSAPGWAQEIPADVVGMVPVAHAADVPRGAGIWMDGDHAFVSALSDGFYVVDVSDPANPTVVAHVTEFSGKDTGLYARDADVAWVGERRIVAFSGQGQGMHIVDATDPAMPRVLATVDDVKPSHNLAVFPTMPLVFNSRSTGQGGAIDVIDISNPDEPKVALSFGEYGCHDITFYVSEMKSRLYCAGVDLTEVWDVADPLDPKLVVRIENDAAKSYGAGLHHSAYATHDGTLLIIGDETFGGAGPGCGAHAAGKSTFMGSLWFYDLTDEKNPVLLSNLAPTAPVEQYAAGVAGTSVDPTNPAGTALGAAFSLSCTSHFGQFVPGQDKLVWGFYRAGVLLIDFADPSNPVIVDQWADGTNVWDVKVHNGYLFTGDLMRGLDVLEFVGA